MVLCRVYYLRSYTVKKIFYAVTQNVLCTGIGSQITCLYKCSQIVYVFNSSFLILFVLILCADVGTHARGSFYLFVDEVFAQPVG